MKQIVIIANRPPSDPLSGGMAPAMREIAALYDRTVWYGLTSKKNIDPGTVRTYQVESIEAHEVNLDAATWDAHYNRFTNQRFWPDVHGMSHLSIQFARADFEGYKLANEVLASKVAADLKDDPNTPIFIQDYHLFALAQYLRELGVKNPIVFFDHTPIPDPQSMDKGLRRFYAEHIFRPLIHADAANFQTAENARNFMMFMGIDNPPMLGAYKMRALEVGNNHRLLVGNFPISINTAKVMDIAKSHTLTQQGQALASRLQARNVFINFERADYTKDLPTRLAAFDLLLERHSELRGKVQLTACAEPSRTDIEAYRMVAARAATHANAINEKYPDAFANGQPPVIFLNESIPNPDCMVLLRSTPDCRKIGAITPFADGMNQVAKEFAAAQNPNCAGPLILSRGAGAAHELGRSALTFEPGNIEQLYQQMLAAIRMPQPEANRRCREMQDHLKTYDVERWGAEHDNLFQKIAKTKKRELVVPARFDYDGQPRLIP